MYFWHLYSYICLHTFVYVINCYRRKHGRIHFFFFLNGVLVEDSHSPTPWKTGSEIEIGIQGVNGGVGECSLCQPLKGNEGGYIKLREGLGCDEVTAKTSPTRPSGAKISLHGFPNRSKGALFPHILCMLSPSSPQHWLVIGCGLPQEGVRCHTCSSLQLRVKLERKDSPVSHQLSAFPEAAK